MRTHRWLPYFVLPAVTCSFVAWFAYASTPTLEATTWTSTHPLKPIPSAPPTMLLTPQNLAPIATFASAVVAQQAASAAQSTTVPTAPASPVSSSATTSAAPTTDYDHRWDRVATCEEGGWIGYAGPSYPDSLGINATNWQAYGGGSDLSPPAQVAVAERIEAAAGMAGYVPDQGGCASW